MNNINSINHSVVIANRFNSTVLDISEICYLQQEGDKIIIHLMDRSVWERNSMETILDRLDGGNFFRCHHSLAVNIDHIKGFRDDREIILDNGTVLTMCRAACLKTKKAWRDYIYND